MNKIFKRIAAAVSALFIGAVLTGCSEYVMTAEDLAVQKQIEGYWVADYDTGYNYFDDDGKLFSMIVMEFTDDFHYLMHQCMVQQGYALTYPPVAYSFEELKFKAVSNGVTSYAAVEFSDDGQKMYWITDEKTDTYLRIDKEEAEELGIPEYDPKSWEESETVSGSDGSDSSESQSGSEGSESVSETSESGSETDKNGASAAAMALIPAEPDPLDFLDIDYELDPSVEFGSANYTETPVVIAETEDGEIVLYGIYIYGKLPIVFIEHDGVVDRYEQDWHTPRSIMPQVMHEDIDGDGEKELAVSYYVSSGTGRSVDELVIYEKGADGHFTGYTFAGPADILNEMLTAECDPENTSVIFNFDGESYTHNFGEDFVYIEEILSKQEEASFRFGDIVSYEFDGGRIRLNAGAGLLTMFYAADVTADVVYRDGGFSFDNIAFDAD